MSTAAELRVCVRELVGEEVPPADGDDPERFYRQWLAEQNLGLVPIADASSFEWPGKWIAFFGADRRPVVMFGAPSGVWLDPGGASAGGGAISGGVVLAPLDVQLPAGDPYGRAAGAGTVAALLVAPQREAPLTRVDSVVAAPGRGLEGDRYAEGRGTFSGPGRGYEVTLVDGDILDEVGLAWEDARRNVVTRGIALNALVGRRFTIGAVTCVGRRLAEPCSHLERLVRPGLLRPLVHRAGLRADILTGGTISVGDDVTAAD